MKKAGLPISILVIFWIILSTVIQSCNSAVKEKDSADSLAVRNNMPPSPVLSPETAITKMHIEKGFTVNLVAAEPLINSPVALTFDDRGRIWAVEMQNYMPDTVGTGENIPTSKVVILSDTNRDGVMDNRKVFLDSLVLPRAICLIDNGILVAEPPRLWYYEIQNDRPVKKTLVDSAYAEGGNVEHQPNGLLRTLDNWIYSAKSDKRYRKKGTKWLIEKTHFRGQWGITQDDEGRLFYNTNSENLLGDYFSPGLGAANKNQEGVKGYIEKVVADNRVYPVRPTPGVNRGYMQGVLNDSLRLVNFTAACGPVIYNAALFPKEYYGNAFVAEPSANLIKRNIITTAGFKVTGREAYDNREFLASEDERFRPVNLYVGPEGGLYVVDMYRGIIQHKTYLTEYLKNEIKQRSLTQPLTCGRIYKIVPDNSKEETVNFANDGNSLVALLQHSNGWVRNKAQQLLIDGKFTGTAPALRKLLSDSTKPLARTHALWTMEGLGVLGSNDVLPLLNQNWPIRMQALSVVPSVINKNNYQQFVLILQGMIAANDTIAAPYIAFLSGAIQPYNYTIAKNLLLSLAQKYPASLLVADAIISSLENKERDFYREAVATNKDTSLVLHKELRKVIKDMDLAKNNKNFKSLQKEFPRGASLFQSVCQTCHGANGNGTPSLAPPLNGSEWVVGSKNKLISIVLYGLTGPVKVGGKLYKAPEINGDMPSIGQNKEFSDEDIAQVLNFVRNSWSNKATEKIMVADILQTRNKYKGRQKTFTMQELNEIK